MTLEGRHKHISHSHNSNNGLQKMRTKSIRQLIFKLLKRQSKTLSPKTSSSLKLKCCNPSKLSFLNLKLTSPILNQHKIIFICYTPWQKNLVSKGKQLYIQLHHVGRLQLFVVNISKSDELTMTTLILLASSWDPLPSVNQKHFGALCHIKLQQCNILGKH